MDLPQRETPTVEFLVSVTSVSKKEKDISLLLSKLHFITQEMDYFGWVKSNYLYNASIFKYF